MNNHTYIFISGLHRSGTSLFYKTLSSADNFSGLYNTNAPEDEGQHLQNVIKPAKFYGGPGKFGFDKRAYMNENHSLATEENRKKIHQSWAEYWDNSNHYLIEKSPPNLIRTRFLQYLFPNSIFITIVRHPIAVSLATQKWSKSSIVSLFNHWIECHEIYLKDEKYLRRKYLFKYEDFVCNPELIIHDINRVLGCNIKNFNKLKIDKSVNERYFNIWDKKYKSRIFMKPYISYIENRYSKIINKYGYTLNV